MKPQIKLLAKKILYFYCPNNHDGTGSKNRRNINYLSEQSKIERQAATLIKHT